MSPPSSPTPPSPMRSSVATWAGARRRQAVECASYLALDQLVAGDLPKADRPRVLAHTGGCDSCRAALKMREAEQTAFVGTADIATLAADALHRAESARDDSGAVEWL